MQTLISKLFRRRSTHKLDEKFLEYLELSQRDIVIDCGASIGDTVDVFRRKGALVHAFEANPMAVEALKKRFKEDDMVVIHEAAVYDRYGTANFYFHEELSESTLKTANGSSLLKVKGNVNKESPCQVRTIDVSDFIEKLESRVAVLKVDIEGAEIEVVNHLLDTGVYKLCSHILVETHERKIPELLKPTELLRKRLKDMRVENINLEWH